MSQPIFVVDAFTGKAFSGNPAGVCLLEAQAPVPWMQSVGAELNLAETAFVVPRPDGQFAIRWFTPTTEVPLCGHATLASAHTLWENHRVSAQEQITFHSPSGPLTADREAGWIRLDFPALPVEECPTPGALSEALGCQPVGVHRNEFPAYLVEVSSEEAVGELAPNLAKLSRLEGNACIVTARSESGACDFVSRFFAPRIGIDEDPVTGAAHCSLGPFWAKRLGKSDLVGHQLSKRGGVVRVRPHGDRVDLLGQAVTMIRGEMLA